jgi:eukaryotic-like serine/threonine-protein kinase
MPAKQVFISYSRKDETFALQVREFLIEQGCHPWIDVYDIPKGTDPEVNIIGWDDAIDSGLKVSDIVLGIMTPESVASHNVLNEWGWAISNKKPLLLLFLRDCDVPHRYARINYIDFRKNPSIGFHVLSQSLDRPRIYQETLDERNRCILLKKVRDFWIKGVLDKSFYSDMSIDLEMEKLTNVIEHPWKMILETENVNQLIPTGKKIIDVFIEMQSALLVLGEPGSGKTITLLELARDAINLAEADYSYPIPVVFNLSSWNKRQISIEKWLTVELRTKYQIPTKIGQRWVEDDALMLLLDGLDEVKYDAQNACVEAINSYREEHGLVPIAVCSRTTDYKKLTNQLQLNGAILIKTLNHKQIDSYLSNCGEKLDALKQALKVDKNLQELAESPLMLNIMCLTYVEKLKGEITTSVDEPRITPSQLFSTYVDTMFNRLGRSKSELLQKDLNIRRLCWLAHMMSVHNETLFFIEQIQPSWLRSRGQQWLYMIITRLIGGVIVGFAPGLLLWHFMSRLDALLIGLLMGLYGGIVIGLISGIRAQGAKNQNKLSFSLGRWQSSIRFLSSTLSVWLSLFPLLLIIALNWLINQHPMLWHDYPKITFGITLFPAGVFSFLVAIGMAIFFGIKAPGEDLRQDIVPEESIRWSWKLAWRGLLAGAIIGATLGIIVGFLDSGINPNFSPWLLLQDILDEGKSIQQIINHPDLFEELIGWGNVVDAHGPFHFSFSGLYAVMLGIPFGFIGTFVGGLQGRTIDTKNTPNQGIKLAFRNAIIAGMVTGLPAGIFSPLLGLFIFLMIFLWFGGLSVIQHITLRVILTAFDHIPLVFERFLDNAVNQILLRKVGGGYIFIHRFLLEHFAKLDADYPG